MLFARIGPEAEKRMREIVRYLRELCTICTKSATKVPILDSQNHFEDHGDMQLAPFLKWGSPAYLCHSAQWHTYFFSLGRWSAFWYLWIRCSSKSLHFKFEKPVTHVTIIAEMFEIPEGNYFLQLLSARSTRDCTVTIINKKTETGRFPKEGFMQWGGWKFQ